MVDTAIDLSGWRVTLFGEMQFFPEDGTTPIPVHFDTQKSRLLFAYLLLHAGRSFQREVLAAQFWPESDTASGRRSLRDALRFIHLSLSSAGIPDDGIVADRNTVRIASDAFCTDVALFEEALNHRAVSPNELRLATYEQAVTLYRGPFLSGYFDVKEAEEWIEPARRRYAVLFDDTLVRLSTLYDAQDDLQEALHYARRAAENATDDPARAKVVRELTERVHQQEPTARIQTSRVSPARNVVFSQTQPRTDERRHFYKPSFVLFGLVVATVLGGFVATVLRRLLQEKPIPISAGDPGNLSEINAFLSPAAQAMEEKDYERALGYYHKALAAATLPIQKIQVAIKMQELGRSAHMRDKGKGWITLAALEGALQIFREQKDAIGTANTLLCLADAKILLGNRSDTISYLKEAIRIVPTLDMNIERPNAMRFVGEVAIDIGEYRIARTNLEEALRLYQKGDLPVHRKGVAFSLWLLGKIASDTGDYPTARKNLTEAIKQMESFPDEQQTLAAVLGDLGDVHVRQGEYQAALPLYQEGLRIWDKVPHTFWRANFKARLALVSLLQAEELSVKTKTRPYETPEGKALVNEAEKMARESLVLLKESNGPVGRALPLSVLGQVLYHKGIYLDEAYEALREGVLIRRQVGNPVALAEALETLAIFEGRIEMLDIARKHLAEADTLRKQTGTSSPQYLKFMVAGQHEYLGMSPR